MVNVCIRLGAKGFCKVNTNKGIIWFRISCERMYLTLLCSSRQVSCIFAYDIFQDWHPDVHFDGQGKNKLPLQLVHVKS